MKKITSALLIVGLIVSAASAAPKYVQRDGDQGYKVTYDYRDKEKNGWYMTLRAELSLLNFENKYTSDDVDGSGNDKYSFEPVFGGSVSAGKRFTHNWRGEIEAGYVGMFTDKDEGFEFKLSVPYALVNGIYDFQSGLYLGAGIGAALPTTTLDGDIFLKGDRSKTSVSPMGALMVGYSHKLDDNFVLDLRYRFAGFMGTKQSRDFDTNGGVRYLQNKIDFVMDNSFSVAIRYEF